MSMRNVMSTIVISGSALQYVHNKELGTGDYAVVTPRLLHADGGFVRGVALDSRGQRSKFVMPIEEFYALQLSEAPAANGREGAGIRSAV